MYICYNREGVIFFYLYNYIGIFLFFKYFLVLYFKKCEILIRIY